MGVEHSKIPIRVLLLLLSVVQACLCYLTHFDKLPFAPLYWLIHIFYEPLYFLLLPIVGALESWVPINLNLTEYRNWMFPYLKLNAWLIGIIFFYPLNVLYFNLFQKIKSLVSHRTRTKGRV